MPTTSSFADIINAIGANATQIGTAIAGTAVAIKQAGMPAGVYLGGQPIATGNVPAGYSQSGIGPMGMLLLGVGAVYLFTHKK